MGLASKIAAAQAAQAAAGLASYPGGPPSGPPTGPPTSQQVSQRPGGPPQNQGPYQPYPGGPSGASSAPPSNQSGRASPYRSTASPQTPSSPLHQQPHGLNNNHCILYETRMLSHHRSGKKLRLNCVNKYIAVHNLCTPANSPITGGMFVINSGPPQGQGGYPPQGGQPGHLPQPPQGGYGQQPQYGHQQGGLPSQPAGPAQIQAYKQILQATIQENGLQGFYPPGSPQLDQIAQVASQKVDILCQHWRVDREFGQDVIKLALFDIILYIDDSGSMVFEESGERLADLKVILSRVAFAASLFDDDGVQVRFFNASEQGNGIRNEQQVHDLVSRIKFSSFTPMGQQLKNKILEPLVMGPARSGQLRKPVLIITVTDGQPTGPGEPDAVFTNIKNTARALDQNPRYGRGAVSYQFAQVGNDVRAREFLGKLDEDPEIGSLVDCTSNFESEADEMSRANPPADLTPEVWLMKLLLGAIDSSYDTRDEKTPKRPQPQGPPQQNYGQQPSSGYGQLPPGQGQYGQQPGGYGGQWQQQPSAGYGRPPPGQPAYGGPQGGYGVPPPPPRR